MSTPTGTYFATVTGLGGLKLPTPGYTTTDLTIVGTPISSYNLLAETWTFSLVSYSTGPLLGEALIQTTFSSQPASYPAQVSLIPTFASHSTGGTVSYSEFTNVDGASGTSTYTITNVVTYLQTGSPVVLILGDPTNIRPISSPTTPQPTATSTTSSSSSSGTSASTQGAATGNSTVTHAELSTGAKAGIAVGCILGALLVASIVAFICLRRRRRTRNSRNPYANETRVSKTDGESYKLATSTVTSKSRQLPQPESDQTISRLANRTLDDIELFVEHYYVDRSVKSTEINATNMLPFSSPYLGSPLADIVRKSSHPTGIFKHCIAYYLLQKIDPAHNKSMSLLPKHFIMPAKGDRKALSQRRVEIAHSRPDIAEDKDYLLQRDRATEEIIQQIERAFQPWARGNTQERAKNLNGTLAHLSELGQKLFAQPATFEWRWRLPNREQTVMLPGLDKLTDSEAVTLATPISLVQPRTGVQ